MIEFLKNWVTNIIILVILISFLEIILPSTSMKRYINMIIGLLIIIVLINPFINLIAKDMNIEREVFSNILKANEMSNNEDNLSEIQDNQVILLYKESIKKEIKDLIYSKTQYKIADLSIDIIEDREDDQFGNIEGVNLAIDTTLQDTGNNDNNNITVKVGQIKEVTVKVTKDSSSKNKNSSTEYNDLRRLISDSYRISEKKVIITEN